MGWLDRLDLLSWISEVLAIDIEAEIDNCQSFFVKFNNNDNIDEFISAANKLGINSDKMNVV